MQYRPVLCLLLMLLATVPAAAEIDFAASSYLGDAGVDDAVVGACIQSDGTIALAANLGPAVRKKRGTVGSGAGCIVRITPDGAKVISAVGVASQLFDLAIDAADNLFLAAGDDGLIKVSPNGSKTIWTAKLGNVTRVDAASDGHAACIVEQKIHVFDAAGQPLGSASGVALQTPVSITLPSSSRQWSVNSPFCSSTTAPICSWSIRSVTLSNSFFSSSRCCSSVKALWPMSLIPICPMSNLH